VPTPLRILLAAALAAIALAGCDGEDDSGSEPAGPATAPAGSTDLGAADELCAAAQAEQERIRREVGGRQLTLDDRARLLVDLAPVRVRLAGDLAALEPEPARQRQARRLVAAAERRGVASERAGALWKRGAPEPRIAAAAAAEHDERVRFVAIARRLGLVACAERLSNPAVAQITRVAEAALTATDPARRCAALGERLLAQEYGSRRACRTGAPTVPLAAEVELTAADGIDGVFAVARVTATGGDASGDYRLRLTFEDGAYRIDKLD
jgi:hypothetical protein